MSVTQWLQSRAADFYNTGIQKLLPQYDSRYEMSVTQWFQSQAADFYNTGYKRWSHSMTNVSVPELNMLKTVQHLLHLFQ